MSAPFKPEYLAEPIIPGLDPRETEALNRRIGEYFRSQIPLGLGGDLQIDPSEYQRLAEDSGFFESLLSAAGPEMIGMEPKSDVSSWREQNPFGSFSSQLIGFGLPFLIPTVGGGALGLKLAAKLPVLTKMVKFAEVTSRPVAAAAVKEVARFAPLELARVGASVFVPEEGATKRTATAVATDLFLIGGLGAIGGAIMGARPWPRDAMRGEALIQEAIPKYNLNWSPQKKLQAMSAFKVNPDPLAMEKVGPAIETLTPHLQRAVRMAENPQGRAYVQPMDFGGAGREKAAAQSLGKRFWLGSDSASSVRRPMVGDFGFKTQAELDDALNAVGLPLEWEANAMYPRFVEANSDVGAQAIRAGFVKNLQRVDHQWWVGKQKDGLYVMAKRIKGRTMPKEAGLGEAKVAKAGDQYFLFQTDNPRIFAKNAARFAEVQEANAFAIVAKEPYNALKRFIPAVQDFDELASATGLSRGVEVPLVGKEPGRLVKGLKAQFGPEGQRVIEELHGQMKFFSEFTKEFVAPLTQVFSKSPRAVMMAQTARAMYQRSAARTAVEFSGVELGPKHKALFLQTMEVPRKKESIESAIGALTEQGIKDVSYAFTTNMPLSQARRELDKTAVTLLERLNAMDKKKLKELDAAFQYFGEEMFQPKDFHYLVSRTWKGHMRLPIKDSKNRIVAIASGHNRTQAEAEAKSILARVLKDDGIELKYDIADLKTRGRQFDIEVANEIAHGLPEAEAAFRARSNLIREERPTWMMERHDVKGFIEDFTKPELKEIIFSHLFETNRLMSDRAVRAGLWNDWTKLMAENPELGRVMMERVDRLSGNMSDLDKRIMKMTDKILAPYLTTNSASRIVNATNRFLFASTLGFADVGFVALNAATPIQTAMPEVAFLLTAPPEVLARFYSAGLVMGKNKVHVVHHLSPLKILRGAFKEMKNPDALLQEHFNLARKYYTIGPRFIESFVGESAESISSFKKVLAGEQGFVDFMFRLSEWGPAQSEEFSRGLAFTMGHIVGRDFFKLEGKQLFRFAEEFTGRTMFNYGTGDRAKLITGQFGTLFGLFKNWNMHYIGNYMNYAGEAVLRGNWKPLLYQNAATMFMAGAGAIPGYGAVDALSRWYSDESLMEHIYDAMGWAEPAVGEATVDRLSDAFFYGFPGTFGVTLQGRAAPFGANLIRDVNMMFSMAMFDRAVHLTSGLGEAIDYMSTLGQHPTADSQRIRDMFIRGLAPRTLYRAIQTSEANALRSLRTQNKLMSDVSIPERVAFVFGFTPIDMDKTFYISNEEFEDQALRKKRVSIYGAAIAEANISGNYMEALRLGREASLQGLPIDSIYSSAQARETNMVEPLLSRQFDEVRTRAMQRSLRVR